MDAMEGKLAEVERGTVYFDRPGKENTSRVLELAQARARALGVTGIVSPTTSGAAAVAAARALHGLNLVIVTHSAGFREPGDQELTAEHRSELARLGVKVLTTTHAFGGVGRAVRRRLNTFQVDEIIAHTLRVMGEGAKVACEITLMAADAGLVDMKADLIALGGTGSGLDTALVLKPAHAQDFFALRIREVICKPRL